MLSSRRRRGTTRGSCGTCSCSWSTGSCRTKRRLRGSSTCSRSRAMSGDDGEKAPVYNTKKYWVAGEKRQSRDGPVEIETPDFQWRQKLTPEQRALYEDYLRRKCGAYSPGNPVLLCAATKAPNKTCVP